MGKISTDADGVFRVSLPTKSVFSTDMLDFAAHSGFDYMKMEEDLVGVYEYTVPATLSVTTYNVLTVAHGQGYMPMSQTFMEDVDGVTTTQFAALPYTDGGSENYFLAYTTSTQFKIDMVIAWDGSGWAGHDFKFKYHIYIND